jgi:putative DNA primase/helicase
MFKYYNPQLVKKYRSYTAEAVLAHDVFSKANEALADDHGYLHLKHVKNHGLRVVSHEDENTKKAGCYQGTLLVPCFNENNELVNLERIYFDKKENKYQKRPLAGGQRNDAYYLIGDITHPKATVLIVEGASTGFTAYEATGYPIAITFNCNNLVNVTKILRKKYPDIKLLIIADDDRWHHDFSLRHAGLKAAKKACNSVRNIGYLLPDFGVLDLTEKQLVELQPKPPTDVNDLFSRLLEKGLDRSEALGIVQQQLTSKTITLSTRHSEILGQLISKISKVSFRELAGLPDNEKLKNRHIQVIVIEQILELAKDNNWGICKQYDFIYLFNGEYWGLLEAEELKTFLGDAAERMGICNVDAQHFNFKDQLYKQFMAAANLPKPEQLINVININLKNGTFEVTAEGNRLNPFNRSDFMTYQLPFEYDLEAKAPLFSAYLDRVLPEKELQSILAEYLGYIFIHTSTLKLEKTILLYGSGANGKSVFYEIVRSLLGEQNTSEFSLQSLTNENGYYRAMIANKLVNYASEINGKLISSIFKQLVSGEPVEARLPYGRPFTLTQYAKLIFNCNELPKDVEYTEAYFRRFLIIPFKVTIPEEEQDKQLAQKIINHELSGVFNWVLQGLERLLEQKCFTHSETVKIACEQYKTDSDSVKLFLEEEEYSPHLTNYEPIKRLYSQYRMFCQEGGFPPVNQLTFQKRLAMSKVIVMKKNVGKVAFLSNKIEYKNYG